MVSAIKVSTHSDIVGVLNVTSEANWHERVFKEVIFWVTLAIKAFDLVWWANIFQ